MAFMGLNPEKARTLSSVMRQTAAASDSLSSEVTAALTLSQLDSELPGQLIFTGEEMEQLGLIIAARVDIAEGFVIDPATLAADVGITVAQAEAAIASFAEPETNPKQLTPFLDALAANKQAAEILRSSFVNLPGLGSDPGVDQALLRLGTWLPDAIEAKELPTLTEEQIQDLITLTDGLELDSGAILAGFDFARLAEPDLATQDGAPTEIAGEVSGIGAAFALAKGVAAALGDRADTSVLLTAAGQAFAADTQMEIARALFAKIEQTFELDGRLRSAAGLPSVEDLYIQYQIDIDDFDIPFDAKFEALDDWLPAYLAGEIKDPPNLDDPATRQLLVELAEAVSAGSTISSWKRVKLAVPQSASLDAEGALEFLRGGRFLQKALIPGDFESIDGPVIVWSQNGVETALLAGRRQGVITDQTEAVAAHIAENVLINPDGTDIPIDLSEEQQQALVAAIVAQNGREFVLDNPSIQRQVVSAVNLVRQQTTLADQRIVFAKAIEAFRSLAVVGSPAVTWSQLKEVVGDDVVDELGHRRLTGRSAKATNKRPQFISLLSHWGIPGEDTIKLKKRKFSFRFDENGKLTRVRNKKLSKWKRFKNSVKAFGKALWNDWTDNPWKYLFMGPAGLLPGANQVAEGVEDGDFGDIAEGSYEMAKFSATIAATIFPATTAAGVAAMAVLAADTVYQATQGNWLGAASSAFGAVGGAAGYFGDVAAVGSTANIISKGAAVGKGVVTAVDVGDDFVAAIEDGDIFAALGSGFALAGSAASVVANGSELANGIGQRLSGNPIVNADLLDKVVGNNPLVNQQLLEQTFTNPVVSSGTIDLIGEFGQTASDLGAITTGVESTLNAIENDNIAGALTSGFATLGRGAVAVGSPNGIIDTGFSPGTLDTIGEFGTSAVQLAGVAAQTGAAIDAAEQGNLAGALVGGINAVGQGVNAVTDDRGIIDDGLGTSERLEGQLRAGGVSLTDLGSVVDTGFATAGAIENGDFAGALSSGFGLTGKAAALAGNPNGAVDNLLGLDWNNMRVLNEYANKTSVKLSEVAELGGSVFAGDALGALENSVDFLRVDAAEGSRLEGQLNVVDEGLQLGRTAEGFINGGEVPDFDTILGQLGDLKTAAERVPGAQREVAPSQGTLVGRDENGNLLIDTNDDGVADDLYLLAQSPGRGIPPFSGPSMSVGMEPQADRTRFLLRAKRDISAIDIRLSELQQEISQMEKPTLHPGDVILPITNDPELQRLLLERSQLENRRNGIEWLIETPGANLDEISQFEGGSFIVDSNTDATNHYFNDGTDIYIHEPGSSVVLGQGHRDAILHHPDLRAELEAAAASASKQNGKLKLNFTTDLPNFHLGRHDVYYELDRSDPDRIRAVIKSDHQDGVKDVGWLWIATGDDQLGPDGEWDGATPFLYEPFEAAIELEGSPNRGLQLPLPDRPQLFGPPELGDSTPNLNTIDPSMSWIDGIIPPQPVLPSPPRQAGPVVPQVFTPQPLVAAQPLGSAEPLSSRPRLLPTPAGVVINGGDQLTVHSLESLDAELGQKRSKLANHRPGGRMPAMQQVLQREIESLEELQAHTMPGIDARIENLRQQRDQLLNYPNSEQRKLRTADFDSQIAELEGLKSQQIPVPTPIEILGGGSKLMQVQDLPDLGLPPGASIQVAVAGGVGPTSPDTSILPPAVAGSKASGGAGAAVAGQIGRTSDGRHYFSGGGDALVGATVAIRGSSAGVQEIANSQQVQVIYPHGSRTGFTVDLAKLDELGEGTDIRLYEDGSGSATQLAVSGGVFGAAADSGYRKYDRYGRLAKENGGVTFEAGSIDVASDKLGLTVGPKIGRSSLAGDIFLGVTSDTAVPYIERVVYDPSDPTTPDRLAQHFQTRTVPDGTPYSARIEIDRQNGLEVGYQPGFTVGGTGSPLSVMGGADPSLNYQTSSTSAVLATEFGPDHLPRSTELQQVHGNVVATTRYGPDGRLGAPTGLEVDLSNLSANEAQLVSRQNRPAGTYRARLELTGEQLETYVKELSALPDGTPSKAAFGVPTAAPEQFGRVVTPGLVSDLNLQLPTPVEFVVEPAFPAGGPGTGLDTHRPSSTPGSAQARGGRKTPGLSGGSLLSE